MKQIKKIIFIFPIVFASCINDVKTNFPMTNYNILGSKKNYFIAEYQPSIKEIKSGNTTFRIKEVWSECAWQFKNSLKEKEKLDYVNFIISFDKKDVSLIDWLNYSQYFNNGMTSTSQISRAFIKGKENQKIIKISICTKTDTLEVIFKKKE
jgi:hypothetical protein